MIPMKKRTRRSVDITSWFDRETPQFKRVVAEVCREIRSQLKENPPWFSLADKDEKQGTVAVDLCLTDDDLMPVSYSVSLRSAVEHMLDQHADSGGPDDSFYNPLKWAAEFRSLADKIESACKHEVKP